MNRTLSSALAIGAIVGLSVPLWIFVVAVEADPPRAAVRDLGPTPVRTLAVEVGDFALEAEVLGNLVARRRVVIAPELAGRIERVHAGWRPGAPVAAGEVLVALDPTERRLQVRAARAGLAEAEAAVRTAEVQGRTARDAETKGRELLEVARREHERQEELLAEGGVSRSQVDQALTRRLDAELAHERALRELEGVEAALAAARARAESARVTAELADEDLGRCELVAPFAGLLVGEPPAPGGYVAPGIQLGELVDPTSLVLTARVPERTLLRIRSGAAATIDFPSAAGTAVHPPLAARVSGVDPVVDALVRHGAVEVEPLEPERLAAPGNGGEEGGAALPAGLFARARVELGRRGGVRVERRHLRWDDGRPVVFVAQPDPRPGAEGELVAERRELELGPELGEGFLVSGGLTTGELLITHPLELLADGDPVVLSGTSSSEPGAGE